ncbi:MAG TPA: aminotransferase class I/II-fold pyridoxal phosphate-dependent enzyme [Clostridiales bacterium]|nr:MAG: putative N-acetyl-LL-diaminopimelate aminotransferase [Firmicutes bacterium ADurb.Bin262]HOU10801.1 aminotransferase class I/II-fold pyridoxal phosphate-dependent enzyme [Clostridiales bacterium]HQH62388.1 aminotransferase class I/II-fold pyridoxal phosphate-dependent enzyme [Clostridiales bacterium]HQK74020.1 aminotransferase class I/II-fold pyridoxal phosphate-dependent enzyme [Clostridiales bacterium]
MDYQSKLNQKIKDVKPSGIRKFFDIVATMDNVISLGIGEPDFQTPACIREAGIQTLREGKTKYTSNSGLVELRQAIAAYYERRFHVSYNGDTDCLITVGGSEAIDLCFRVLLSEGDEVVMGEPSFVCYGPLTGMSNGVYVPIATKAEDKFRLKAEDLKRAITPKTKLLVLSYPNNPTGAILERSDLEAIADIVRGTDIIVIADEIYGEFTYSGKTHVSIAELPGMKERTIIVSGFSKAFAMTGWRLGYALGPRELIAALTKLHQHGIMSAPTIAQYAALTALEKAEDDVREMMKVYDMRRRLVVDGFNAIGLDTFEPEGAFYCFPCIKKTGLSSEDFSQRLLDEKKVAVVPGTAFGDCGEGFVRVSYCYSTEHLEEALKRIGEFVERLG